MSIGQDDPSAWLEQQPTRLLPHGSVHCQGSTQAPECVHHERHHTRYADKCRNESLDSQLQPLSVDEPQLKLSLGKRG